MKRAKLGLLEVLGLLVRMPGEGDIIALPCFAGELGFFSLLFLARTERSVLLFSRGRTLRLCFSRVDVTLFLAGGHKALSHAKLNGQMFRLCLRKRLFSRGWTLYGFVSRE